MWELKTGRHHSDNRVVLIVQLETLAYGGCFAAEVALPKSMAQHNHHVVPGFRFVGGDASAQLRLRTQHRKQIRVNPTFTPRKSDTSRQCCRHNWQNRTEQVGISGLLP